MMAACTRSNTPQVSHGSESITLPASASVTSSAIFEVALNDSRRKSRLGPLRRNQLLDQAAQAHALDMINRRYFSHASPGGPDGDRLPERVRAQGCLTQVVAENLAFGQRSETEVFKAWQDSPGHNHAMLGASFTQYGFGKADDTWVLVLSKDCLTRPAELAYF